MLDSELLEKIKTYEENYENLMQKMAEAGKCNDVETIKECGKKIADLEDIINLAKKYRMQLSVINDAKEMIKNEKDEEMREFLKDELNKAVENKENLEDQIKRFLTPKDPNDKKNILIEIRAGAGGDEAALFAGDLYRMYTRYAESKKWQPKVLSSNPLGIGGFKEIIFEINGIDAYGTMKYESGVHRVQRIPVTESGGRIHTSTITVAVLPEAEDVDVHLDPGQLRIDVFRSSGPGGQSVNTTDSAVRITHIPTGIIVTCQDEKSQLQNKERALKILRARLLEIEQQKQLDEETRLRRSQIGTGDRSERIRTYNYPQSRITDHRINFTTHRLNEILEGDMDELVDALKQKDEEKKLEQIGALT
ncbi:MAG: peptide chain release factor 1 [Actinobacteria bacterium]|nr:peptide chain release factor 1 [Actinomycetota bacterium]